MNNLLKAKSEFRKKGVVLTADKAKQGGGGSWKFASEDNFIKTIQEPLSSCGLEYVATMDYVIELGVQTIKAILYHIESGENITSTIVLPEITPKKDKNGNPLYLDAEIERGKQFGYWSRILGIRLLGLSDIDPEDMNNRPQDISDEATQKLDELRELVNKSENKDKVVEWIRKTYNVQTIQNLNIDQVDTILIAMKKKAQDASA